MICKIYIGWYTLGANFFLIFISFFNCSILISLFDVQIKELRGEKKPCGDLFFLPFGSVLFKELEGSILLNMETNLLCQIKDINLFSYVVSTALFCCLILLRFIDQYSKDYSVFNKCS